MSFAILLMLLTAPPEAAIDTAVVCPQGFRQELAPWLLHRRRQGHGVAIFTNELSAPELRAELRSLAQKAPLRYLVLVGDADPAMLHDPALRTRGVPTHHAATVEIRKFGPDRDIATDNWYADLDDDRVPDLAVGRLTADSPSELGQMVARILAYENNEDFGRWRGQLHFVAGMGGFGAVADAVVEAAAKTLIVNGVPADYDTTMTYARWQSPYCPDPRQFRQVTIDRFNEGSLLWVYMGHGNERTVDWVHVPGAMYPILSVGDTRHLDCRHGAPIACFLACYTGAFDQPRDCLAEEMLRRPGGPVAVLCGSRMTMPYSMTVMGAELLAQVFGEQVGTVGDAVLAAKRKMVKPTAGAAYRAAIDAAGTTLNPATSDLAAERAEHLDLFNLLGDPLVRIPYPHKVDLKVVPAATAGGEIEIAGTSPMDGQCTVELVVKRGRLTFQPPKREPFTPHTFDRYGDTYQRANEPRLASARLDIAGGRLATKLTVPRDAYGACHVRVFVQGTSACAVGAADVQIAAASTRADMPPAAQAAEVVAPSSKSGERR